MAPRVVLPPKKNRARCGIKYPLKIFKGDLGPDSEYLDDDLEEDDGKLLKLLEVNEGNEHHLQAALATKNEGGQAIKAVFIPTPGAIRIVDDYEQLYPSNRWKDPISFLRTTQTVEEACSNAFVDHEFTYYMDEIDKQWLDKNNQEARGEGTSAQGARSAPKGKDKSPEIGVPVSISEDEFELVMGLLEKITDQQALDGDDGPDFSLYQHYFLKPLPADTFASYVTPSWMPPPALLVRIARTVFPHWKLRRSLLKGSRIRPSLNYDESDFLNESYVCFRRRDNKPIRKTRAAQAANNADKLAQLHQNLSQALDIANALLMRENVKQAAAVQSHNVWQARHPMADLLRKFPSLITKADEERLFEKPRKTKSHRSSLPKVKVLPPTQPGTPPTAPVGQAIRPSERYAAIQQEIMRSMQQEVDTVKSRHQVDVVDDPYQPTFIPRAEKMWVDVPPLSPSGGRPPPADEPVTRDGRSVRLRYGRGGRRFLDRRSISHPYLTELRNHRQHADDDLDEETARRLQGQWRFDADCALFGPAEEEDRELVDEYDSRYLMGRMAWATEAEAALVTDASIIIQRPDGRDLRVIPDQFLTNVLHCKGVYEKPTLAAYLAEEGIIPLSHLASSRVSSPATGLRAVPAQQKTAPSSPASPHPRAQAPMRPPASPASSAATRPPASPASSAAMRAPASPAPPKMQENISPKPGSVPSSPARTAQPRTHATLPQNPNPIAPVPNGDAVKVNGGPHPQHTPVSVNVSVTPRRGPVPPQPHPYPLQTNGARTAVPAYVPLSVGTNTSLKLPSRVPRPSPLTTHSVVAAQIASSNPSRANES
ncbi:enhancer of polycomb-like-domain-containing protein [Mycena capillaripes]|nr:enhancer of polycomb-like-domain-containing protein [Mycena capillaripes]